MTTLKDMNALATAQDFSAELVRELIGDYCVRGKAIDASAEDPVKLFNRVDWIVNRIGRALDVSGKLDPAKTSFRVDRDAENVVHVRFVDLKSKTLYTLDFGDKAAMKAGGEFEYILKDETGAEVARGHKWSAISGFFAPEKEVVVKKAAAPKKAKKPEAKKPATKKAGKAKAAKKEKAVKAVKNPVPAQPATEDVMAEVDAAIADANVIDEEIPPAKLG